MAVRRVRVNGRNVWQARVAYRGLRRSTIRESKQEARNAEAALLSELQRRAEQGREEAVKQATLRSYLSSTPATCRRAGRARRASAAWSTPAARSSW